MDDEQRLLREAYQNGDGVFAVTPEDEYRVIQLFGHLEHDEVLGRLRLAEPVLYVPTFTDWDETMRLRLRIDSRYEPRRSFPVPYAGRAACYRISNERHGPSPSDGAVPLFSAGELHDARFHHWTLDLSDLLTLTAGTDGHGGAVARWRVADLLLDQLSTTTDWIRFAPRGWND